MKKFVIILLSMFSILFLFACGAAEENATDIQREPAPKEIDFQELTTAQVKRVYIVANRSFYRIPIKWAEMTYDDMDSLVALLNQVVPVGEASDRFTDKTGSDWHMYRIELYNGQEFDFACDDDYYVIDLKGYDGDSEIGMELFRQYHGWCEKYFPEDYSDAE